MIEKKIEEYLGEGRSPGSREVSGPSRSLAWNVVNSVNKELVEMDKHVKDSKEGELDSEWIRESIKWCIGQLNRLI